MVRNLRWVVVLLSFLAFAQAANFELVPAQSEARYRVKEQLANLNFPNDAVGVTKTVQGVVAFDSKGAFLPQSNFSIDLSTLKSDESRRDGFIRQNTLQTDRFPKATFKPKEVKGLTFPLAKTGKFNVQITGDLTIRNVTKPVTWEGELELRDNTVQLKAKTRFTFKEFDLTQPRVFIVLSVDEFIQLEVDFVFKSV